MKSTTNSRFPFFEQLDQGINQFVNDVLQQETRSGYSVPASAWELSDRYVLKFDLPGVSLGNIELQVHDGILEVSGERHVEATEDARVTLDEQPSGKFTRKLRLAKDVDTNEVDAELDNGVLTVTLKKVEQATPQKVQIRSRQSE